MAKLRTSASFSVSEDIAKRAGLWGLRYLTPDGRVLLSEADLRHLRLEPSEYVHGIDAVEITADQAGTLMAEAGYRMLPEEEPHEEIPIEETIDNEEVGTLEDSGILETDGDGDQPGESDENENETIEEEE